MDSLDLNIQNYNLEDILQLFHLSYNFTEKDLKNAYKMALKTHPDKSKLNPEIFRFFIKAYNVLSKIYYFRNKKEGCTNTNEYTPEPLDKDKVKLLRNLDGKSVNDFNIWFNNLFEKSRVKDDNVDNGYGEWYKNYHDKTQKNISMNDFGREFENEKEKCKALVVKTGIHELTTSGGIGCYDINRDAPQEYSSEIFSKLNYEDLKKAHTENVVPVTKQDFERHVQFKNVDSYKHHRSSQDIAPLSLQQSKQYLKEKEEQGVLDDTRRIFSIIKRDEEIEIGNKKWWGHLQQLK